MEVSQERVDRIADFVWCTFIDAYMAWSAFCWRHRGWLVSNVENRILIGESLMSPSHEFEHMRSYIATYKAGRLAALVVLVLQPFYTSEWRGWRAVFYWSKAMVCLITGISVGSAPYGAEVNSWGSKQFTSMDTVGPAYQWIQINVGEGLLSEWWVEVYQEQSV